MQDFLELLIPMLLLAIFVFALSILSFDKAFFKLLFKINLGIFIIICFLTSFRSVTFRLLKNRKIVKNIIMILKNNKVSFFDFFRVIRFINYKIDDSYLGVKHVELNSEEEIEKIIFAITKLSSTNS